MTLALQGKSRQRQLFLVLLAIITAGAAVLGGAVVQNSGSARAFEGIGPATSNPGGFDQCAAPNIMFVIDNSTSINETAGQLAAMIAGLNQIVDAVEADLPDTNWAGVRFQRGTGQNDPTVTTAITGGWEQGNGATTNIKALINGSVSNGYTPTAAGIQAAINLGLGPNGQTPLMLIVTDGDPNVTLANVAGITRTAYVNGAIDAVVQATAAREAGWNTALAYFGGQDVRAEDELGTDYPAYRDAVRAGLAGTPNGPIAGRQIVVGNASGLAAEIIALIQSNCAGNVTINKILDGEPAAGWEFSASVSGGTANPAGPYTTAGTEGSVDFDVALAGATDVATVSITETEVGGTEFGGVTCTGSQNDGQHTVNLETRTVSGIEVGAGDEVSCTFTNRTLPQTNGLTVKKMVWNGEAYEESADPVWNLRYALVPTSPSAGSVATHGVTVQVPFGAYNVAEAIPDGWQSNGYSTVANPDPQTLECPATPTNPWVGGPAVGPSATTGTSNQIVNADTSRLVCFYNAEVEPEDGRITIEKFVYNPDTDTWDPHTDATPFTFNIDDSVHQGVGPGTYNVAPGSYTVSEVLPVAGYEFVALWGFFRECPDTPFLQEAQVLSENPIEVTVEEDADVLVCAYNEPAEGSLTIEKYVYNPETDTWDAHTQATPFTFNIDDSSYQGVGPGTYALAPGDYTVSEVLPVAGYEFVGLFYSIRGICPTEPGDVDVFDIAQLFQQLTENEISVEIYTGETVVVCAYNEPTEEVLDEVNLFVRKFEAPASNSFTGTTGLAGWTINLECLAGECETVAFPGSLVTNGGGLASFGAVPFGTYEVCEVPQAGYAVVGSLLDGANPQGGECRVIEVNEETAGDDITIVVDFFNHPEAGIRVEKRQLIDGLLDVSNNGGWEITVEGCGNTFTRTTNEAIPDSWTFFDVPPCDSYVVSENVNSKPGYTPVGPTSVVVSLAPGDNALVRFVNDLRTPPTPTPTPPPGSTPTPVPPTSTPVVPTDTPDPEVPTATPTPIDEVEGEITPGASPTPDAAATPIPPASGSGTFGGGTGSNLMVMLLALIMTTSGIAFLALGRNRTNGEIRR